MQSASAGAVPINPVHTSTIATDTRAFTAATSASSGAPSIAATTSAAALVATTCAPSSASSDHRSPAPDARSAALGSRGARSRRWISPDGWACWRSSRGWSDCAGGVR